MTNQEAITIIGNLEDKDILYNPCDVQDAKTMAIKALEQEPKTGHWIKQTLSVKPFGEDTVLCDKCAFMTDKDNNYNYCPNCGARMVEPQETETWNGIHAQITAPKGTFERIFNDADDEDDI